MVFVWGDDDAADRECCLREDIQYCEPDHPYTGGGNCYHPHAREIDGSQEDGWPSGDTVRIRCPVCGMTWRKELPQ